MTVYRSIGESELLHLIRSDNPVYGTRKWDQTIGSGCKQREYGTVCFFRDNVRWIDHKHQFHLTVNIPDDSAVGTATYMASENFGKTKVFTGRTGKTEYKVEEAYSRCYWPADIVEMDIGMHYANHFVVTVILPFCRKYGIVLVRGNGRLQ